MENNRRWDHPCSDCSALLGGRRSLPGAHEYLIPKAPALPVYECLICGSTLGCDSSGQWSLRPSVAAFAGSPPLRPMMPGRRHDPGRRR